MNLPASASPSRAPLRRAGAALSASERFTAGWQAMAPRERRWVSLAAWVFGLCLLWWVLLGPALTTLRQAPAQQAKLDAQLARMQNMAASAEQLRGQSSAPIPSHRAAQSSLEQATLALGATAQLSLQGDRASLTLQGVSPEALALWLNQARINARAMPVSAQLEWRAEPKGWHGQLVVAGPGLGAGSP